ncbi:hypothetical protein [Streptomyces djakartensis]|uniref:Secreted protein n=1 Tax=Streptomyces djakartensis TaxID=68193 RepID=A0ABQ2ZNE8_9ACTN|nr:hypothetical protein [Streptomyces djakartensis]GGY18130.1 hypothetical protein GCM10010384_25530 [Streptomyces djakartensis]
MRKYQKAAVVAAMLGSVSFLGAGVSHAGDDGRKLLESDQTQLCSADEINITGSETGAVFAPVNGAGLQFNDLSDRNTVNCAQIFGLGG